MSMKYHFLRYFFRNNYLYNMFDIGLLIEIGINSLRLIENRLEIDWGIIDIDIVE